jgi:hypothetical protein
MLADLKFFVKTIIRDISNPSSPKSDDEFDYKKLRIKIPVSTYIACDLCKNEYVKEHHKKCPCLSPSTCE